LTVLFSMSASLDGYVAGPGGDISWGAPDPELHQFHNDRVRGVDVQFLGRGLYETMLYWEDPGELDPVGQDFAQVWQALPKVVFSSTLTHVEGNARLATGTLQEELARYEGQVVEVGGATLAGALARENLIDEYHLFLSPVVLGAGTPYFPPNARLDLEVVEQRMFGGQVVYLRLTPRA
jgi:dihydrofolate reductase